MKEKHSYKANPLFLEKFPSISGNSVNGLGECEKRRASPFFWHKPELHRFGALQKAVTDYHRQSKAIATTYTPKADRGPKSIDKATTIISKSPEEWTKTIKSFVLDNEGSLVGIARIDPMWVYEGFEIDEPRVIVIGVAMDHDRLSQAPASFENPISGVEVGDKYNQAARACRKLANFILSQGYDAKAFQGPYATALNMVPMAIAAGLGELGKHGSIINRQYGSNFRLSAVTTNMLLISDETDEFGADNFCTGCQVCSNACPPDAIFSEKQWVRGEKKWYVNFDKCIPYFGDTLGCAICIARCPWSTPDRAPRLAERWTMRKNKEERRTRGKNVKNFPG